MTKENDFQQGVFDRLSKMRPVTQSRTIKVDDPIRIDRDSRAKELRDEFDMVDQRARGSLDRQSLLRYLQQKYQVLNTALIDCLLEDMEWVEGQVTREEFCRKYLRKELELASSINRKRVLHQLNQLNRQTLEQFPDRNCVLMSVNRVEIDDRRANQSWHTLVLQIDEINGREESSKIIIKHCDPAEESVKVLLPCQVKDRLQVQVSIESETDEVPVGRAFIDIRTAQLRPGAETLKRQPLNLYNRNVGELVVAIEILPVGQVEQRLVKMEEDEQTAKEECKQDELESEYLHFLWGGLPSADDKIPPHKLVYVSVLRWAFIALLVAGSTLNHIGERFDPLTLLFAFSILTLVRRVWLKLDLVQFLCLAAISLFSDVGWLVLSQFEHHATYRNSHHLNRLALVSTLLLMPVKLLFVLYLVLRERTV